MFGNAQSMDDQIISEPPSVIVPPKGTTPSNKAEPHSTYQSYCTLLETDPNNETAWLGRARTARGRQERRVCLDKLTEIEKTKPYFREDSLDILIGPEQKEGYEVRVLASPMGETKGLLQIYPKAQKFKEWMQLIDLDQATEQDLVEFGTALFTALFTDGIGENVYRGSLDQVSAKKRVFRILLRIEAPDLAALPWELLYDTNLNEFLAIAPHVRLVRYPQVLQPLRDLEISLPIRVLVIISSPIDWEALDTEAELFQLRKALVDLLPAQSNQLRSTIISLEILKNPVLGNLEEYLRKGFHIVHFIGHGTFDKEGPGLVIANEDGRGRSLSAREIAELFSACSTLRLVVLNCCESAKTLMNEPFLNVAEALVNCGVPSVIAMRHIITDEDAITFSQEFYNALTEPSSIDLAVGRARRALLISNKTCRRSWTTPVLFMRAYDGTVINIMTYEQAVAFFRTRGFTNLSEIARVYDVTKGHPLLTRLIADLWMQVDSETRETFVSQQIEIHVGKTEAELISTLYSQLLSIIPEKHLKKAMRLGPVVGLINSEIIHQVLKVKTPEEVQGRLQEFAILEIHGESDLTFPRQIQEVQMQDLEVHSPKTLQRLAKRMVQYCEQKRQQSELERDKKKWLSNKLVQQVRQDREKGVIEWIQLAQETQKQGEEITTRELVNEMHSIEIWSKLNDIEKAAINNFEGDYWAKRQEIGRASGYYKDVERVYYYAGVPRGWTEGLRQELTRFILMFKPEIERLQLNAEQRLSGAIAVEEGRLGLPDLGRAKLEYEMSIKLYRKLTALPNILVRTISFFFGNLRLRNDRRYLLGLALTLENLGVLHHKQHHWRQAEGNYVAAISLYTRLRNQERVETLSHFLAYVKDRYTPAFVREPAELGRGLDIQWLNRIAEDIQKAR